MKSNNLKDCKELCWICRTHCQETLVHHCLEMGGQHVEKDHVKLMMDCIQMCQTAADFMDRNSALHASTCEACAKVCEACAESCAKIDSEHMRKCAEICRRCAASCREMSGTKKAA
jgi:hypothetical protein